MTTQPISASVVCAFLELIADGTISSIEVEVNDNQAEVAGYWSALCFMNSEDPDAAHYVGFSDDDRNTALLGMMAMAVED